MRWKLLDRGPPATYAIVLATGDETIGALQQFVRERKIDTAALTAIGAFERAVVGYFDWQLKDYRRIPVEEQVQVLSLIGARDAPVIFQLPIEIADDGTLERTDRGQRRGVDLPLAHELLQRADRLIAGGEHDCVGRGRPAIEQFPTHGMPRNRPAVSTGLLSSSFRRCIRHLRASRRRASHASSA